MRLIGTILGSFGRIPLAVGAIIQGVVFVVLTVVCGAIIGAVVGRIGDASHIGLLSGLGVGALLALGGFASAVDEPVGPAVFIEWFFHSVFLTELALGLAVLTYFLAQQFLPDNTIVCVLLAFFFGMPASFAFLSHLFPQPSPFQVTVAEPLSTFEDAVARANLFARMKHGPAATRRAQRHDGGWTRFKRKMDEIRRRFYDRK